MISFTTVSAWVLRWKHKWLRHNDPVLWASSHRSLPSWIPPTSLFPTWWQEGKSKLLQPIHGVQSLKRFIFSFLLLLYGSDGFFIAMVLCLATEFLLHSLCADYCCVHAVMEATMDVAKVKRAFTTKKHWSLFRNLWVLLTWLKKIFNSEMYACETFHHS
jgi:hypothetical protein